MKLRVFIFAIIVLLSSCKTQPTHITEDKITMKFYNPTFNSVDLFGLRTDGYYEITSFSGSYTADLIEYEKHLPTYGFIQFFNDGFCRICPWNGMIENPEIIEHEIKTDKVLAYWGIYKIEANIINIEFISGRNILKREVITGLYANEKIIITNFGGRKYSYPENKNDSLTSSCIGKFRESEINYDEKKNYLKTHIDKYLD